MARVGGNYLVRHFYPDDCRLLKEWSESPAPVFFDLGDESTLWWLLARRIGEPMYIASWSRAAFIAIHHGKGPEGARNFDELTNSVNGLVTPYNAHRRLQAADPITLPKSLSRRFTRGRL